MSFALFSKSNGGISLSEIQRKIIAFVRIIRSFWAVLKQTDGASIGTQFYFSSSDSGHADLIARVGAPVKQAKTGQSDLHDKVSEVKAKNAALEKKLADSLVKGRKLK